MHIAFFLLTSKQDGKKTLPVPVITAENNAGYNNKKNHILFVVYHLHWLFCQTCFSHWFKLSGLPYTFIALYT